MSGKTDYLIAGHKLEDGRETHTSGKYRKAKALGTIILDEAGFEKLVREKSGVDSFEISNRKDLIK